LQLLTTRIKTPSTVAISVARPRLLEPLERLSEASLALVTGPAGYGKSSLLVQWYDRLRTRGGVCAWFSYGPGDRDTREFLAYMALTLERGGLACGPQTRSLLENDGATARTILASLLADLDASPRAIYLFLDDAHLIRGTPLEGVLSELVCSAPPSLHVIVATRAALALPLARLRANGRLFELDAEALRFSAGETRRLWETLGGGPLAPEELGSLAARTEGWVAGLKLASLASRGNAALVRDHAALSGRRADVAAFFAEEVISNLPAELQDYLMRTSILERFSPELGGAVAGVGAARARIDEIERAGLFLFSLDDERTWYRYHHLFADFLRNRLQDRLPDAQPELHERASAWFRAHGYAAEAFDHAVKARAFDAAAEILDERCLEMFYGGQLEQLAAWVERLPAGTLRRHPRSVLTFVWKLILEWKFDEARRHLASVEGCRGEPEIASLFLHREMMLAQFEDDMPAVAATCHELLRGHSNVDAYVRGTYETSLLYARRESYALADAESRSARALDFYERSGSRFVLVWHHSILGPTRFRAGDVRGALDALETALEVAISFAGRGSTLASMPALQLAEVRYERNETAAAAALVDEYLDVASELGFVDQLVAGYVTGSRLCRRSGDEERSRQLLERGYALGEARGFERLRRFVAAEELRVLLLRGEVAQARRRAAALGMKFSRAAVLPYEGVTSATEAAALAFVRLALADGDVANAASVARLWRGFAQKAGALGSEICWSLLVGECAAGTDERAAQRVFRHAVVRAAPGRFRSTLIDAGGAAFEEFLGRASAEHFEPDVWNFVAEVCRERSGRALSNGTPAARPLHTLAGLRATVNPREREILSLVGRGMLNREIADALGLSVASVKWHLQQIYNKTGTRRRFVAAQAAHEQT
jgi:LuxR family maltose regulon positive regulatory protein